MSLKSFIEVDWNAAYMEWDRIAKESFSIQLLNLGRALAQSLGRSYLRTLPHRARKASALNSKLSPSGLL